MSFILFYTKMCRSFLMKHSAKNAFYYAERRIIEHCVECHHAECHHTKCCGAFFSFLSVSVQGRKIVQPAKDISTVGNLQYFLRPFRVLRGQVGQPQLGLNLGHLGQQETLARPVSAPPVFFVGLDQEESVAVGPLQKVQAAPRGRLLEREDGPFEGGHRRLDDEDVERAEPGSGHQWSML